MHYRMGWTHHEVGKVDVGRMASTLQAANDCGFTVPPPSRHHEPSSSPSPTTITAKGGKAYEGVSCIGGVLGGGGEMGGEAGGNSIIGRRMEASVPPCACAGETPPPVCGGRGGEEGGQGEAEAGLGGLLRLPRPRGVTEIPEDKPCVTAAAAAANNSDGADRTAPRDSRYTNDANLPLYHRRHLGVVNLKDALPPFPSSAAALPGGNAADRAKPGSAMKRPMSWSFGGGRRDNEVLLEGGRPLPSFCRVVVVGGGASGLSAAACLRARGEADVLVLER